MQFKYMQCSSKNCASRPAPDSAPNWQKAQLPDRGLRRPADICAQHQKCRVESTGREPRQKRGISNDAAKPAAYRRESGAPGDQVIEKVVGDFPLKNALKTSHQ